MGFIKTAFTGLSWMAALRAVTRSLAVVKTAILARILLPSQFGIYGIATLVLGFLESITETGINIFLIQEKGKVDKYVDSSWFVSILRGIVISVVILILSPVIANFFNTPGAKNILILVSIVPIIRGFINPASVKFQKDLQFNKQFYYDSSLFFVDTAISVALALITSSENSLIWGMIIGALVEVIISFVFFSPKPKFIFDREKILKVINRGKWITGAGAFNYMFLNLDDIIVGRFLGSTPLGLYQQGYKISSLPVSEVGEIFNKVTFPIYATIEGDRVRLKSAFVRTLLIITMFVVPFGLFVFFFSDWIVTILLGNNWLEVVPVLKVLAIFGVMKAISNSFFSLFLAIKKQEIVTVITFVSIVVMALVIYPLVNRYGMVGAGISTIVSTLVTFPFVIYYYKKFIG